MLKLSIPFKSDYLLVTRSADHKGGVYVDLQQIASLSGITLSARNVEFAIDGDLSISDLTHPFDSLPTHFTGLAMKIYAGTDNRYPCVELKASPAKLLQGHNVFGSTSLELCSFEFLHNLDSAIPHLYKLLDVSNTLVDRLDVTFSARVQSHSQCQQAIAALRAVSNGQTKSTRAQEWETTVMWNQGSRHRTLVAYLKYPEFIKQLNSLKSSFKRQTNNQSLKNTIAAMSNPKLIEFTENLIRFEARLYQRYLSNQNIPLKLFNAIKYQKHYESDGKNLIFDLWVLSFKDLNSALEGSIMNIYDDEKIFNLLKDKFHTVTSKGNFSYSKAHRLFGFYRRLLNEGYDNVLNTSARNTFWRHVTDLQTVGFSKAQLQNLTSEKNNVVPLLQVIKVDFSTQRPDWYQEPISLFDASRLTESFEPVQPLLKIA